MRRVNPARCLGAVHHRHAHVHQDHVRAQALRHAHRLPAVLGDAGHRYLVARPHRAGVGLELAVGPRQAPDRGIQAAQPCAQLHHPLAMERGHPPQPRRQPGCQRAGRQVARRGKRPVRHPHQQHRQHPAEQRPGQRHADAFVAYSTGSINSGATSSAAKNTGGSRSSATAIASTAARARNGRRPHPHHAPGGERGQRRRQQQQRKQLAPEHHRHRAGDNPGRAHGVRPERGQQQREREPPPGHRLRQQQPPLPEPPDEQPKHPTERYSRKTAPARPRCPRCQWHDEAPHNAVPQPSGHHRERRDRLSST